MAFSDYYKIQDTDNIWWCEKINDQGVNDDNFYFSFDKKSRYSMYDKTVLKRLTAKQIALFIEDDNPRAQLVVDNWKGYRRKA